MPDAGRLIVVANSDVVTQAIIESLREVQPHCVESVDALSDLNRVVATWMDRHHVGRLAELELVGHGAPGLLRLGSAPEDRVSANSDVLCQLRDLDLFLARKARVRLVGCDVGNEGCGVRHGPSLVAALALTLRRPVEALRVALDSRGYASGNLNPALERAFLRYEYSEGFTKHELDGIEPPMRKIDGRPPDFASLVAFTTEEGRVPLDEKVHGMILGEVATMVPREDPGLAALPEISLLTADGSRFDVLRGGRVVRNPVTGQTWSRQDQKPIPSLHDLCGTSFSCVS